jgi:hypothetical protein
VSPFVLFAAFAACAGPQDAPAPAGCIESRDDWRRRATDDDRRRLREWRTAWLAALAQARAAGHEAEIASEGALLDPDAALPGVVPPPGDYACRTVKVGSPEDLLPYVAYPAFRCRIAREGGGLTLVKLNGSQRPIGRLFPESDRRLVFLGTMQLGDERRAYQYGIDRERDLVGAFERIGDGRWRLAFPSPHFESLLDVIDLTPLAPQGTFR